MWRLSLRPPLAVELCCVLIIDSSKQTAFRYGALPDPGRLLALLQSWPDLQSITLLEVFLVSNLHGMPTNNQPTQIIWKYLINFLSQLCALITIVYLGILALIFAWKFIIKTAVQNLNPISNVVQEFSKLRKIMNI